MLEVRTIRKNLHMTQQQLAEKCGVGRSMISYIEDGKYMPSVKVAQKIGKALHIDWWLIYPDMSEEE